MRAIRWQRLVRGTWERPWLRVAPTIVALVLDAGGALAANELCGQTLTQSTTLTADQACTGTGLNVGADGITIDLGGFTLSGDGGEPDDGVDLHGHSKVTIRNGTIRGFFIGVTSTGGTKPAMVKVTHVVCRGNTNSGISMLTQSLSIDQSSFLDNGANGAFLECEKGKITSSGFVGNVFQGVTIVSGSRVTITKSVITLNGESGLQIPAGEGIVVKSNFIAHNHRGIELSGVNGAGAKISKNVIVGNETEGMATFPVGRSVIDGNLFAGNGGDGLHMFRPGALSIVHNRFIGNHGNGVFTSSDDPNSTIVQGNTALANGGDGISVDQATTVTKNVANANQGSGIFAPGGAVDGGGNRARANVGVDECSAGIVCPVAFTPKAGPVVPTCGMHVATSITLGADTPVCAGGNGLIVDADGVTINLNGHRVVGDRTAGTTGILSIGHKHIAITNGIVDGFDIGVEAPVSEGLKITNVESRNNSLAGAVVDGSGIAVSKSVFRANGGPGLIVNDGSTAAKVTSSFFVGNANSGLVSRSTGTAITSIVTAANQGNGVLLNGAGNGGVQGSTIGNNGTNGIRVDQTFAPVALKKNVVAGNLPEGILLTTTGTGTTVDANVVGGNGGTGIAVMSNPPQNALRKNAVIGNGNDGIFVDNAVGTITVARNTAIGNPVFGIIVDVSTSTLTKNLAVGNFTAGIATPFGAVDGGGNVAHDNIGPQQCTAPIVCQ